MRQALTIIPAAGNATRMGGLPKFLLPTAGSSMISRANRQIETLLTKHIEYGLQFSDLVIIATRPENASLLTHYLVPGKVELVVMQTETMTETVLRVANLCPSEQNLILMPDTFFSDAFDAFGMKVEENEQISIAVWNIEKTQIGNVGQIELTESEFGRQTVKSHEDKNPNCNFPFLWGAMNIPHEAMLDLESEMPHIGYLISKYLESKNILKPIGIRNQSGIYVDCGTPRGFFDHLLLSF